MNNSALFPSGDWYGYYTYDWREDERYPIEMNIHFHSGYMISASGGDPEGEFTCSGLYCESERSCFWQKQYQGADPITYTGRRVCRGIISGSWNNDPLTGSFVIWPFKVNQASLRRRDPEV